MMARLLFLALALALCQLGDAFAAAPAQRSAFASVQRAASVMKTGDSVAATMRKQSDAELTAELDTAKAALYDMRHKRATRQTVKTSDYDMAKYKINMINMIMTERVAQ